MRKGKVVIDVNDVIGKRLGKLEVTRYVGNRYDMTLGGLKMRHYYECKCDCGVIKNLRRSQIIGEIVHSCGCLRIKQRRKVNGNTNEE